MNNVHTFEEFLNESYNRRWGNFEVALGKEKIEYHWLDEMTDVPVAVIKLIEHFGKTSHKEICVILERDNKRNYDSVRGLATKFGVMALFGLDTESGRCCVVNTSA